MDETTTPTHVKRGARVVAVRHDEAGETRNGAPVRAGDWVVEHGNDIQEVISPEAFEQTYEAL